MAIVQTVENSSQFSDAFHAMGRGNNFSYEGLKALYDFLEDLYDGQNYELDVIALCSDFSEMTKEELVSEYSDAAGTTEPDEVVEYVTDHTLMITIDDDNFIVQGF